MRKRLVPLLLFAASALAEPLWAAPEVRLLIDVSGSMRQNDPGNLRVPALRLVTELLPAGSRAGVWLFAERPEVLIPPGQVDDAWKRKARAQLGQIHSRGLLTDVEQAIAAAVSDWKGEPGASERHLVLLTDGLIDVSKDDAADGASRERIQKTQLAELKALGVKVHTVALSDKVDMALMRELSTATSGWLETAQDANALQRIFLHMLEQTAAPTTVPLTGNRFEIDDQVSELTLLAFRAKDKETELVTPDGQRISAKQLPKDAHWRSEEGYDLVTLPHPKPGRWQLAGVEDPDTRVVVVTELGIVVGPLPGTLSGEARPKDATWLTDHGQPVARKDLRKLLKASAEVSGGPAAATAHAETSEGHPAPHPDSAQEQPTGAAEQQGQPHEAPPATASETASPEPAHPDAAPGAQAMALHAKSGRFMTELDTQALAPGDYALRLVIDGGTFKRQVIKHFKVAGPLIRVEYDQQVPTEEDPSALIRLKLIGEPDLVDPAKLLGYILVKDPDGKDSVIEIPASARLPLGIKIPVQAPGDYLIKGQLLARTLTGEALAIQPPPQTLRLDFAKPTSAAVSEGSAAPPVQWLWVALYLLGGNALLGALLGLTWWLLRHPVKAPVEPQTKTASQT